MHIIMMAIPATATTTTTTTTLYQAFGVDGGLINPVLVSFRRKLHLMAGIDGDQCILLNFIPEI